jgi:hypothetical protein
MRRLKGFSLARTENKVTVNNFVGGLVSDCTELNNPPNTTIDEDNCDLDRKGSRKRRLGIDFEEDYQASDLSVTPDDWPDIYVKTWEWRFVAEDGNRNFLVAQSGNTLSFYDLNSVTISAGELPFSVNLDDFRTAAYYSTAQYGVQVASGKGALFVVGEAIEPFYIQYDPDTNTISTTEINIQQRDLALQDTTLSYTDQPTTLTATQKYDLYNQGWNARANCLVPGHHYYLGNTQVLDFYRSHEGKYPPKSKSWWIGNVPNIDDGVNEFSIPQYNTAWAGNTLAPLGTFILDAFNQDRSTASGIPGIPVVTETSRPTAVAFGAGRVFYGFKNKIFFSQLIRDDFTVVGKCYQVADPTAEKINDLVATDGGVITINEAGAVFSARTFENSIFFFFSNGCWGLGGSTVGSGFSATDFSVYKVTETAALSPRSILDVLGTPVWWAKDGIYILQGDPAKQGYTATNILLDKLQLFYNAIPPLSKLYATGAYDRLKKTITWIYNSNDAPIGGNKFVCDKVLNYDTLLKAFYPYTLSDLEEGETPHVVDVFSTLDVIATSTEDTVIDEALHTVTDEADDVVTVLRTTLGNTTNTTSLIKFYTFYKA